MLKPEFLPIRVNVIFQWKVDKNVDNLLVKPFDNVKALISQLTILFENKGDPVLEWNQENLRFKIIGPLAGQVEAEESKDIANIAMS